MRKILTATLTCLFVLGISTTAKAVLLAPGDFVPAVEEALPGGLTLLATIDTAWAHGEISGTFLQEVYRDTADGRILFLYEVDNDPGPHDTIRAVTATNFKGYTTYVAYDSASVAPLFFDRSATGTTVGFDFTGDRIGPGEESAMLWVKTNATEYGPGETSIINGGSVNIDCYGPAVPEPASMALLGLGLFGLGAGRLRKRFIA